MKRRPQLYITVSERNFLGQCLLQWWQETKRGLHKKAEDPRTVPLSNLSDLRTPPQMGRAGALETGEFPFAIPYTTLYNFIKFVTLYNFIKCPSHFLL